MTRGPGGRGLPIGETLKEARTRLGMEIAEAEEKTKIRARYIRAMEAEEWEVLPGTAYTRAFIRTYAQILGLDGEMLADQYRRAYDEPPTTAISAEPLLERRRPSGGRPPSRGPLIAALGIAIVVILLLLGIFGGDDDGDAGGENRQRLGDARGNRTKPGGGGRAKPDPRGPIAIRLRVESDARVCLVGEDGPLIDAQLLAAGSDESFDGSARYRVDVEAGALEISAAGRKQAVEPAQPVSYEVDEDAIKEISYAGPGCQ